MDSKNQYADFWFLPATKKDLDDTVAIHPTSAEGEYLNILHEESKTDEIDRACYFALNISRPTVNILLYSSYQKSMERERTVNYRINPVESIAFDKLSSSEFIAGGNDSSNESEQFSPVVVQHSTFPT